MRSDNIDKLAGALAAAQAAMNAASRDRKGHHNNSYATLDSIIDTVRKPLSENGLAFTQLLQQGETGIVLETFLLHSSGQWLQSELPVIPEAGNRGINGMQALGVSITYLKRYALSAILGVSTEEDTDGNEAHPPRTTETRQPYNASQPAPNGNGSGSVAPQPRTAEQVKDYIAKLVSSKPAWGDEPASDKQKPVVAMMLEECFDDTDEATLNRRTVTTYLFGAESIKQLSKAQAAALLTWLMAGKGDDGKYILSDQARAEANAIVRAHRIAAGQAEMFDTGNSAYAIEGEAA